MAGKRKAEGIALLSVYGGDDDDGASLASSSEEDDDDEEEEEGEEEEETEDDANRERPAQDARSPQADGVNIFGSGVTALGGEGGGNQQATESPSGTHTASPGNLPSLQPENTAEGGLTLQSSEAADGEDKTSRAVEGEKVRDSQPMELDILNDFFPPVPAEKYTGELQAKFSKYLGLKKTGKSLNEQLRNTKGYRNPDFLQSAVRHYDIDHIGSCFKKEVFDPHGYDQGDYFDAIALEIRREAERKELERRQTQRVDFVRNSIQTAVAVVKPNVPLIHKVTTTVTSSETTIKTEGRSSKKSKWDKVDVDGGRTAHTTADAIAVANAHAALLTASANAGAGYASFAQQRRREAEEKSRVTEKVLLSSSSKSDRKTERS